MSAQPQPAASGAPERCITCADEGVPMRVLGIDERRGLALCSDAAGARHTVETALLDPLAPGATVLVHAGVAIAALPEEAPA